MIYEVYHGRTVSDPTFDYRFVGSSEANDQYGPGFYFTDVESEAARYSESGGSVIKALIEINKPLTDKTKLNKRQVDFMLRNSPEIKAVFDNMNDSDAMEEAFYETRMLSNLAENFESAYEIAVDMYVGKTALDGMMSIWNDNYKHDPDIYLQNLIKLGYDGVIIPSEATIYVVFSPTQIKVIDVKLVESIGINMKKFINSFKSKSNEALIESIIDGYELIFENEGEICDLINKHKDKLEGGKSDNLNAEEIAKKHGISTEDIKKQIQMGIKIEQEHTDDPDLALEIALDHLEEIPDYYTRLKNMESEAGITGED